MLVLELQVPPFPLLAAVGRAVWQPGVTHGERTFDAYDLIICIRGVLYMEEDGVKYEIAGGKMLVLEPGKHHRGYRPTEVETEVYWIHFRYPQKQDTQDNKALLTEKNNWKQPPMQRTDQDIEPHPGAVDIPKFGPVDLREIRPLLDEMVVLHAVLTLYRSYELQVVFGRLLLALQSGMRARGPLSRSFLLSEQVAAYLAHHLETPFDSAEMERELHYHFDYLARCLKQYTGMSPLVYRHHLQVERAKRLLAHTERTLSQIGELCGFQDYNYFARLFKRTTALTPGEYRKRYQVFRMD
ncbi:AraC family transcriptional regulator [Paenibacillus brevis]|uniref:AraC family transcriptional regulator n=1 Tax=Paenibacillus brevis TaxID=2841508 RepID=A0ABS6FRG5_9BACL|nr:AraC family transcriptional regulator [Paenibacillus brevis]MBU5672574.1 AraC family transcriptional regulator [Paenibacillus brevis]